MPEERRSSLSQSGNGHDACLICGYKNPWSLGMRFEASEGETVRGRFQGSEGLQGYRGLLHGGVLAALLDSAMVHCLFHHGAQAMTGDLHVRFVHPVSCRATVDVQAQIVSANPPLYYLKADILLEGEVMAWGEATFVLDRRTRATSEAAIKMDSGRE